MLYSNGIRGCPQSQAELVVQLVAAQVPTGTVCGVLHPSDALMTLPAPLMKGKAMACVTSPWERCSARSRPADQYGGTDQALAWLSCLLFSMRSWKRKQGLPSSSSSQRCL